MAALLDANQDPSRANDENAKYEEIVILLLSSLQAVCCLRSKLNLYTDCRTLWMGDLAYWMDENFIFSLFLPTGALQTVKIIRNKASNASEGYGFVEFTTHAAAEDVLQTLNGTPIPNTDQIFRLNWAAFGVGKQTHEGTDNMMMPGNCEAHIAANILAFVEHIPDVALCCSACGPLHLCRGSCARSD